MQKLYYIKLINYNTDDTVVELMAGQNKLGWLPLTSLSSHV
jgi:hypothetical protein